MTEHPADVGERPLRLRRKKKKMTKKMRKKIEADLAQGFKKAAAKGLSKDVMAWLPSEEECNAKMAALSLSKDEYGFRAFKHPEKGDGFILGPTWLIVDERFDSYVKLFMVAAPRHGQEQQQTPVVNT
jgi:hypothetical protein